LNLASKITESPCFYEFTMAGAIIHIIAILCRDFDFEKKNKNTDLYILLFYYI
jgi:hypothetical protein